MIKNLLPAINYYCRSNYQTVDEAVKSEGVITCFDAWMKDESLIGYTSDVICVLAELGIEIAEEI